MDMNVLVAAQIKIFLLLYKRNKIFERERRRRAAAVDRAKEGLNWKVQFFSFFILVG